MKRNCVRIRFRKEGDLRLIGHLDLVRAFERVFRRCRVQLRMSEGDSSKPRMHFTTARGPGEEGPYDVAEIELTESLHLQELLARLCSHTQPGLVIEQISLPAAVTSRLSDVSDGRLRVTLSDRLDNRQMEISPLLSQKACVVGRPCRNRRSIRWMERNIRMQFKTIEGPAARLRNVSAPRRLEDLGEQGRILNHNLVETAT